MRVTAKGEYALIMMLYLSNKGYDTIIKMKEIAETEDISINYLNQLSRKLKKAKLIRSARGSDGGYYLAKAPDKITVLEVLEAVGEKIHTTSSDDHRLSKFFSKIDKDTLKFLKTNIRNLNV